jgi:hypothetical protein
LESEENTAMKYTIILVMVALSTADEAMTKQEAHQLKILTQELLDRHKIGDLLTQ